MIRFFPLAAMLLILSGHAVFAQAPAPALECHDDGINYVIGVPEADGRTAFRVGEFTKPDQDNPCSLDAAYSREFAPSEGNFLHFLAIADDLLVLTESTGPEYFLEVYNLALPEPLLKVDAFDVEPSELGIHYYEPIEPATPTSCSRFADLTASGMGAVVAVERFFPFSTGQVVPGKGSRCYQTP